MNEDSALGRRRPAAGQLLLGEEDTVQQGIGVELQ